MKPARRYAGGHMSEKHLIAGYPLPPRWALYCYRIREHRGHIWMNLKLVAGQEVPFKANYWLGYDSTRRIWSRVRDVALLRESMPGMLLWAEAVLRRTRQGPRMDPQRVGGEAAQEIAGAVQAATGAPAPFEALLGEMGRRMDPGDILAEVTLAQVRKQLRQLGELL